MLVPLPSGVLEDVEVLGLYDVIRLAGYNPVLCLLVLRRLQEIDWSHYHGADLQFFGYDFKTEQVFNAPQLCTNKRSKTDSGVIVGVLGHKV